MGKQKKGKKGFQKPGRDAQQKQSKQEERAMKAQLRKDRKRKKYQLPSHSVKAFDVQLNKIGCRVKEVDGDGNCLFRSLNDQIHGDPEGHWDMRQRICDYIEEEREDFEPFMEDDESFDDYISRMREDGEWGGNQELCAAARLFDTTVIVHQFEAPRMELSSGEATSSRTLHVCYRGETHYDSVRSIDDIGMGEPEPITLQVKSSVSKSKSKSESAQDLVTLLESCPSDVTVEQAKKALSQSGGKIDAAIEIVITQINGLAVDKGVEKGAKQEQEQEQKQAQKQTQTQEQEQAQQEEEDDDEEEAEPVWKTSFRDWLTGSLVQRVKLDMDSAEIYTACLEVLLYSLIDTDTELGQGQGQGQGQGGGDDDTLSSMMEVLAADFDGGGDSDAACRVYCSQVLEWFVDCRQQGEAAEALKQKQKEQKQKQKQKEQKQEQQQEQQHKADGTSMEAPPPAPDGEGERAGITAEERKQRKQSKLELKRQRQKKKKEEKEAKKSLRRLAKMQGDDGNDEAEKQKPRETDSDGDYGTLSI